MVRLRGITWDHPRGYAGLETASTDFAQLHPAMEIAWARHPLHHFESHRIGELAVAYDLIVLDHPCMGEAWQEGCLVNLSDHADRLGLSALEGDVVGRAMELYHYEDGLWALPLDAACQVATYRHDLLADVTDQEPRTLTEVLALCRGRYRLAMAFKGVHALMNFCTMCANFGEPPFQHEEGGIVPEDTGLWVLEMIQAIFSACPPEALGWASIDALDALSARDDLVYCPYVFGFAVYSQWELARRQNREPLTFTRIPGVANDDFRGAVIGGAGLAISRHSANQEAALVLAAHLLSAGTQKRMALHLGQPARRSVWQDTEVNAAYHDFYRHTLATIDQGYLRPRYPGYVLAQYEGGQVLERFLRGEVPAKRTLAHLNKVFQGRRH